GARRDAGAAAGPDAKELRHALLHVGRLSPGLPGEGRAAGAGGVERRGALPPPAAPRRGGRVPPGTRRLKRERLARPSLAGEGTRAERTTRRRSRAAGAEGRTS